MFDVFDKQLVIDLLNTGAAMLFVVGVGYAILHVVSEARNR
jgi:hypothetical protein